MQTITKSMLALLAIALTVVPGQKIIATAQGPSIPACAEPALLSAIQASGCQPTEIQCICSKKNVFPSVLQSIQESCSPADIAAVEVLAKTYCGASAAPAATATADPLAASTELPSSITAPASTATTTSSHATLLTDTSPLGSTSYHKTMTYSTTATATPTSKTQVGGAAETGAGMAGLALAVAGMGWIFAEL